VVPTLVSPVRNAVFHALTPVIALCTDGEVPVIAPVIVPPLNGSLVLSVAEVAVAAFPVIEIPQVPDAPPPVSVGE
jgi:hypothetical protein